MAEGLEARSARRWFVGEHQVEPVRGELHEQVFHLAFAANDMHGLGQGEDGLEDFVGHKLGEGIHHADVEAERLGTRTLLHRVHHFPAEGENFLGETQHDLAGVGERVAAALAAEKFFAEGGFQFPDLLRDGRLRNVQRGGGAREAAFPGNRPEVTQVVVIEPFHRG